MNTRRREAPHRQDCNGHAIKFDDIPHLIATRDVFGYDVFVCGNQHITFDGRPDKLF
jgi:hypothetical protein